MKARFHELSGYVLEVYNSNYKLKQILSRLEHGTKATPRTWFYESQSPEWILDCIVSRLNGMPKDLANISHFDLSKQDKYGPQGEAAPLSQRLEKFDEYYINTSAPKIINDPLWQKAKQQAVKLMGLHRSAHPTTGKEVTARGLSEDKYNTSSGFDLYAKRKLPSTIDHALDTLFNCIEDEYPTTLGSRASMGKIGKAARFIFMGAMSVNIRGQRYQQPLQDYIRRRKLQFFLPWEGFDATQIGISAHWKNEYLKVGADYTAMDQHFNVHHGLECFDVIKHFFRPQYWDELKIIIKYVFAMPVLTNLGITYDEHCMPSGSEWTNFLETVWNYIFNIYLRLKYHLNVPFACGIGDDQLWFVKVQGNEESIIQWFNDMIIEEFNYAGLPGNPSKQEISFKEVGFLQRFFCNNWSGRLGSIVAAGVYPLIRNVTSQVFPEFYHSLKKDKDGIEYNELFALRVIMIAENCVNHPLFEWYVKDFIAKANPNILEFVRRKDADIVEVQRRAKKVANVIPTYNQEKQEMSILRFETMKLLRSVA